MQKTIGFSPIWSFLRLLLCQKKNDAFDVVAVDVDVIVVVARAVHDSSKWSLKTIWKLSTTENYYLLRSIQYSVRMWKKCCYYCCCCCCCQCNQEWRQHLLLECFNFFSLLVQNFLCSLLQSKCKCFKNLIKN